MTEGTVTGWLKKPGDLVRKNEPVLTVSTDKVEMEVESLVEGTLGEIIVQEGSTVVVGTVLAYMESGEKDVGTVASEQPSAEILQESEEASDKAPVPRAPILVDDKTRLNTLGQRRVSPRAKRLAKELGVDAAKISGSGSGGEIVEDDIRRAASTQGQTAKPNLRRRQLIAERLVQSIQTIPAFSVAAEANAEKLLELHENLRRPQTSDGNKLTITDLLLRIFASALRASPEICATWDNSRAVEHSAIDIGMAVATPDGVVAPVLKQVDRLNLSELVATRHDLADKARRGKLTLAELEGGISTLSNLGMYRVDHFEAIISPGQSSILAVGSIRKRPWVSETLEIKPTVILNLTVDHRIADGAAAATFLGKLMDLIEEPSRHAWQTSQAQEDGSGRRARG
jgi:pyruvate dehydrogenase E2 component (dihydrolipoamide acetyltransferase)